jgi:hypothetical protein
VKASRSHRLVGSIAVLCALLQPLLSSNALVGMFSLLHAHGHGVSLLADSDHLDLVLSHATSVASDVSHAAEGHVHAASVSQAAHVVHLAGSDVARDSTRRDAVDARASSLALPLLANPSLGAAPARSLARLAYAPPPLQTVVLRI